MFRKIFPLFLACIMIFCGSCMDFTKLEDVTVETNAPPKIVFLGDSIAAGFGLEGYSANDLYNCRSYANILGERYGNELDGKCGHTMINRAVYGSTSSDLLEMLESGELDETLAGSDAVVISIGGNDMLGVFLGIFSDLGIEDGNFSKDDVDLLGALKSLASVSDDIDDALEQFRKNLKLIVSDVKEKSGGEIFVQTLYDPFQYFTKIKVLAELSQEKVGKFNEIIAENAAYGDTNFYTVADLAPVFDGRSGELTNIPDFDIHPNAQGHTVIAEVVNSAVRKHVYTYTETVEVTDTDAVNTFVWICIAAGAAVVIVIICVIVALKRRKRKNAE